MKVNYLKFLYIAIIVILLIIISYLTFKLSSIFYNQSIIHTEYLILLILFFSITSLFIVFFNNINFIILVISSVGTLYLCEIYIFIKKEDILYLKNQVTGNEVFLELKKKNPNKKISKWIGASFVYQNQDFNADFLPLGSISNSQVVWCNEQGYWVTFNSDRFGFNNIFYDDSKKYDFLIIGDSFAEGACLEQNQNLQSNLNLKGLNGVSLGKGGNSSLLNYANFKEYHDFFKPKYVLWIHYENDIGGIKQEMRSKILRKYLNEDNFKQNLVSRQDEIDEYLKFFFEKKNNTLHDIVTENQNIIYTISKILKFFNTREAIKTNLYTIDNYNYELFKLIMEKTRDTANKNNSQLIFFYAPAYEEIYKIKRYKNMKLERNKIFEILNNLNIKYYDLTDEIFLDRNINYYPNLPDKDYAFHYNSSTYKLISDFIYSKIIK